MSKTALIAVSVAVPAFFLIIVGWSFFGPKIQITQTIPPKTTPAAQTSSSSDIVVMPDRTIKLPFGLDDPAIAYAFLRFSFFGNIKEIKQHPAGALIITDASIGPYSSFTIDSETEIYYGRGAQRTKTTLSSLVPNQKIEILAVFNLRTKQWKIIGIGIPSKTTQTSTPSATQ